jgi:hypothetical protein
MARSPAEIQAEIRLNRRAVEAHLDLLERRLSLRRWAPYAAIGGALLTGLALSRLPVLRLIRVALGTMAALLTAIRVAEASGRLLRALAEREGPARAAGGGPAAPPSDPEC